MTRNAAALVVGIDRYDDNDIPVLSGSVHDAKISVAWLLKIGVPVERIHLHVSPQPAQPADFDGVPVRSARLDDIFGSLEALSKKNGDQLFLFLSGHGLYVPGATGGPIFLAQDYGSGLASSQKNMRMQGFIQWMLSWPFRDQFLFYDACQNPSTSVGRVSLVKAIDPPMLDALPVAVASGMLACFSASPGQTAWAGTGAGVLVRHVLQQLDPDALADMPLDAQQQSSVIFDWNTGSRQLDLRSLFVDIVAPAITEDAAQAGNAQNPACIPYGTATASSISPILDLPDEPSADLSIRLFPIEATAAVKVRLSIQTPARNDFFPHSGKELANPFLCKGPVAAEVVVSCSPKSGSGWRTLDSPQKAVLGSQPARITLNLAPSPPVGPPDPLDMYNIRVTDPDGSPFFPLGGAYEGIAKANGLNMDFGEGVSFNHHENGPDIGFDASVAGARESAAATARDWLSAIRRHISHQGMSATMFSPGTDPDGKLPNIRFSLAEGGAVELAGFLGGLKSVAVAAVGDDGPALRLSLSEIEQHPRERVDPGPHRVTVDLPWGRWSRLIYPGDTSDPVRCSLPSRIGREPLRNVWLRTAGDQDPATVDSQTARRIATGLPAAISTLGQIVVDDDRIEPFSRTSLPEWDVLFSAGRLDVVSEARIRELASDAPADLKADEHALLMLGLGHTALFQGFFEALRAVLAAIDGVFKESLDYALLANRLQAEDRNKDADTQAANIRRHGNERDRNLAPPIILHWSAAARKPLHEGAGIIAPLAHAPRAELDHRRADARRRAFRKSSEGARTFGSGSDSKVGGPSAAPRSAAEQPARPEIDGEIHERLRERQPATEPPAGEVVMAKNIVLCCDGTSNEFARDRTNVAKLCLALEKDPRRQLVYYHPGLGTMAPPGLATPIGSWVGRLAGLGLGYGIKHDISDAYAFIMNHFEEGDRIYLFGFSRGAYTARAIAALLHMYALAMPGNEPLIPYAVRMMWEINRLRARRDDGRISAYFQLAAEFKAALGGAVCKPHFVGVWDTVSSVGWIGSPVALPYTRNNPDVAITRHAIAIDERRAFFRTNLYSPAPERNLHEVWFPGTHGDVGGGHPESESGLSKIALDWMIGEARAAGLLLDPGRLALILGRAGQGYAAPDPNAALHDSMTMLWRLAEFVPKRHWNADTKRQSWQVNAFKPRGMGSAPIVHDAAWSRAGNYAARLPADAVRSSEAPPPLEGAALR